MLKCLRGLMMLLPQTDAFHTLVDRLKVLSNCNYTHDSEKSTAQSVSALDEAGLLKIFGENQPSGTAPQLERGWGFMEQTPYIPQESTFSFQRELSLRNAETPTDTQST